MSNITEWTLIVKFKVDLWGKTYLPWNHKVKWKEYKALSEAPYVRVATDEEIEKEKWAKKVEKAARVAKWMFKEEKKVEKKDDTKTWDDNGWGAGNNTDEPVTFTEDELRALPEPDLRKLYAAECKKAGKATPPANIGIEKIITNLLK